MFEGEIYLVKKPQDTKVCENVWRWAGTFRGELDLVTNSQYSKVSGNVWRLIITLTDDGIYVPSRVKMLRGL